MKWLRIFATASAHEYDVASVTDLLGALAGIRFTMSLFIAGEAFPDPVDFAAAKIAIFIASLVAGILGVAILWKRPATSVHSGEAVATKIQLAR